jgi:CDP-diacylglycerol pyrophosphatase
MGAQSLLLTGAYFGKTVDEGADNGTDGSKGFYLIDSPVNFERDERGNAEAWLDHDCAPQ